MTATMLDTCLTHGIITPDEYITALARDAAKRTARASRRRAVKMAVLRVVHAVQCGVVGHKPRIMFGALAFDAPRALLVRRCSRCNCEVAE